MSRFLTLEEYLERFVDDNTQPTGEDDMLIVTEQQAQKLGFFFLNGLAGIVECAKLKRSSSSAGDDEEHGLIDNVDQDDFVN